LYVSPYDVPEAVRGDFDGATQRFNIDFRYLSEEDTRPEQIEPGLQAMVGIKSERLYRLSIDLSRQHVSAVELRLVVNKALDRLKAAKTNTRSLGNYTVAGEIISNPALSLFQSGSIPAF